MGTCKDISSESMFSFQLTFLIKLLIGTGDKDKILTIQTLYCTHLFHLNFCINALLKLYVFTDLFRVQVGHLHRLPVAVLVAGDAKLLLFELNTEKYFFSDQFK